MLHRIGLDMGRRRQRWRSRRIGAAPNAAAFATVAVACNSSTQFDVDGKQVLAFRI